MLCCSLLQVYVNIVRFRQIFASSNVVVPFYPWHILVFNIVILIFHCHMLLRYRRCLRTKDTYIIFY